jgi:RNA polymerase sigma factor (sigma-70 family)
MGLKNMHNEKMILRAISQGEGTAFNEFFNYHHHHIGQYVFSITKSREIAEEIVQDIFLKIWQERESLTTINNISSYLFILARNQTLNAIRKLATEKKNKQNIEIFLQDNSLQMGGDNFEAEMAEIIESAVANLPPQQQKVFLLRQQGMKHQQIAAEMSISLNSAKKYQQLAIQSIEKMVKTKVTVAGLLYTIFYFF